jgi:AMMECR1 domain-containing protein
MLIGLIWKFCFHFFVFHDVLAQDAHEKMKKKTMFGIDRVLSSPYILFLPLLKDERNEILVDESYRVLEGKCISKIFLIIQADDPYFYGIVLPLFWYQRVCFSSLKFCNDTIAHLAEHALFYYGDMIFEDHIAQHCDRIGFYCPDAQVVPMVVGKCSDQDMREVVLCLDRQSDENSLFIICSDCNMLQDEAYEISCRESRVVRIVEQDSFVVQSYQRKVIDRACLSDQYDFIAAHLFLSILLEHYKQVPLTLYLVGYDVLADPLENLLTSHVAFVFDRSHFQPVGSCMSRYEKYELLSLARRALVELYDISLEMVPFLKTKAMVESAGLFVSLYTMSDHGVALRGSMGRLSSCRPMHEMIYQMAQQAAYDDRYRCLRQKELDNTIISVALISDILTSSLSDDDFGRSHGCMMRYKNKVSIHLPLYGQSHIFDKNSFEQMFYDLGINLSRVDNLPIKVCKFHTELFQEE